MLYHASSQCNSLSATFVFKNCWSVCIYMYIALMEQKIKGNSHIYIDVHTYILETPSKSTPSLLARSFFLPALAGLGRLWVFLRFPLDALVAVWTLGSVFFFYRKSRKCGAFFRDLPIFFAKTCAPLRPVFENTLLKR